ncbi:hypothetical protein STIUS_v1c03850 [Spiroplasma sp. TIUS-1]|uniref:hypothetical protein n=1 Tax=Spiroplasma sp. TIUS-1 TaxID=216963 RepID=UPI0013980137|nr:hypothetical protein [Spiroplasma sp. TIUS-1]QHX35939.1 hypothetical protein STIUS_v1c03850 [Spiroplasma sp. TIUS-1]
MINYFKTTKITEEDIKILKRFDTFWLSFVQKEVKRLNKFTSRFKGSISEFIILVPNKHEDLIEFERQIMNYKNFFNQKYKQMKDILPALNKLRNWIGAYNTCLGITIYFNNLCKFIKDNEGIKNNELTSKFNDECLKYWEKLGKEVRKHIGKDHYLDTVDKNFTNEKETFLNFRVPIKSYLYYIKSLAKKKKITEIKYTNSATELLEFGNFIFGIEKCVDKYNSKIKK